MQEPLCFYALFTIFAPMKQILRILLFLTAAVLSACRHTPYPSELHTADSLCLALPDSAVTYLRQIGTAMQRKSKPVRMYYDLLRVKAADRAYKEHESDSLILPVVTYYEQEGDPKLLPQAYYYAGRVYYTLQDAPRALEYYQKCLESMENGHDDPWVRGRAYSQMTYLFSYQGMYKEALRYLKEVYQYDVERKDSSAIVYDLKDLAYNYQCNNQPDSALYCYKRAHQLAKIQGNQLIINTIQGNIAALYVSLDKFEEAKKYLVPLLEVTNSIDSSAIFSIASDIYQYTNCTDSATYYYKKLLMCGKIEAKSKANMELALYALEKDHPAEAVPYLFDYISCEDSIKAMEDMETLRKMNALYDYRIRERENVRLLQDNYRKQQLVFIAVVIILVVTASFVIYLQYSRRKHHQLRMQLAEIKRLKEEEYKKSAAYLEENKRKLAELEARLISTDSQNQSLLQELERQKELIMYHNRQAEIYHNTRSLGEKNLQKLTIYQLFHSPDTRSIGPEEWKQLEEAVNSTYPGFTEKLSGLHQFSEHEMHVCLLIKIGVKPVDIGKLTNHSKESVSSTRRRLCEKILKEEASPQRWDGFILSL